MASKRKAIVNITITEVVERKALTPVWKVFAKDTQVVRFNKELGRFEFAMDPDWNEWEEMEWNLWLGDHKDNKNSKADIAETLTNLLALIKATN